MVGIIKFFGILSMIVAVILIVISAVTIFLLPTLLPLGASALLGGALLLAFARVVELLEAVNLKLDPISRLAASLAASGPERKSSEELLLAASSFPKGSTLYNANGVRLAVLPDQTVIVDDPRGKKQFTSPEEYRQFAKDKEHWEVIKRY